MFNYSKIVKLTFLIGCINFQISAQKINTKEVNRLEKLAQQVTIIRDNWGIQHV